MAMDSNVAYATFLSESLKSTYETVEHTVTAETKLNARATRKTVFRRFASWLSSCMSSASNEEGTVVDDGGEQGRVSTDVIIVLLALGQTRAMDPVLFLFGEEK